MRTGEMKINWVSRYMPLLNEISREYSKEKPLSGLTVGMSIHLEAKTAYLAITLSKLGAKVVVTGSNPLSTQDDVAEALAEKGIIVYAKRTHDENVYRANLVKVLDEKPDFIIDDGGDLTVISHLERTDVLENLKGVSEETTTGVKRLRALEKSGKLRVPIIAVNDSKMKFLFDNRYGTGQSTWDSIMRNTNLLVAGKRVVVAGYGWCGRGIALRASGLGAKVIVTEVDPVRAVEAIMDGFEVMPMREAVKNADFVITATGNTDVLNEEDILSLRDGVILANAGHFNVEIPVKVLEKIAVEKFEARPNVTGYVLKNGKTVFLLAEGRLVNLAAGDGHPVEIMDLSFALQIMAVLYLLKNHEKLEPKVYTLPPEIDEKVAKMKLAAMKVEIDKLTEHQRRYLESWQ
ncbi:adenosylhomocysteinase [Thermotoga sp. KOL6]|uniref:adenosylhomocysteinase n=1 Tax=Thermotoga sp. KOL6 TaxID=126741 RepID=UPI000C763AD6|nr:adenosylhomocysteinase [Thermotoga sp. KOL6]PLV58761.1 adenosylhomocysteinase [Thermotoga sp. KOL6]